MQGMQALPKAVLHVLRHAEQGSDTPGATIARQIPIGCANDRRAASWLGKNLGGKVRGGTALFVLCLFSYAARSTKAVRNLP